LKARSKNYTAGKDTTLMEKKISNQIHPFMRRIYS
jgi:hypothetical protein